MDLHKHAQSSLDPNTIQELEALRGKLGSLQDTFGNHIAYLKEPKCPFTWPDLLNKFNMLTAKFASLSEDFYRCMETGSNSTLPKLMLHPYIPTTTESETNILSVLLRTKLIPDIEKLEHETQAALAHELMKDNSNQPQHDRSHMDDEQLIRQRLDQWTQLRQRHDRIATDAANFVTQLVNDHRDTFLQRLEDEEDQQQQEDQQEWQKMGFPSEEIWRKWKLECMVNFYSSGRDQVPGSDLKKLATNAK